jgi:excisionase family DNA binding protein
MTTAVEKSDRYLTIPEVAETLRVSTATIHRLVSNRQLPAVQLAGRGSTLRVSERELHAWLFGSSESNGDAAWSGPWMASQSGALAA